jgi:hypothetical protein
MVATNLLQGIADRRNWSRLSPPGEANVKTHLITAVIAIIGTVIGGLILAWLAAPKSNGSITAEAFPVELPITTEKLDFRAVAAEKNRIDLISGVPGLADMITGLRFTSSVQITELDIANGGSVRSGAIETHMEELKGYTTRFENPARPSTGFSVVSDGSIKIGPLDPGANATLVLVSGSRFGFNDTIRVLNGDRAVNVVYQRIPDWQTLGLASYISRNAPGSEIFVFMLAVFSVMLVALVTLGIYANSSFERLYRFSTKNDLRKRRAFTDYVQKNHPEALVE